MKRQTNKLEPSSSIIFPATKPQMKTSFYIVAQIVLRIQSEISVLDTPLLIGFLIEKITSPFLYFVH